ncbi:peroxin [Balamuthia mandrillaris]
MELTTGAAVRNASTLLPVINHFALPVSHMHGGPQGGGGGMALSAVAGGGPTGGWLWSGLQHTVGSFLGGVDRRVRNFVRNHKKGLFVTAVVGGVAIYSMYSIQQKWKALQAHSLHRFRLQAFFDNTQQTCDSTILSMVPTLADNLKELVEVPNASQLRSSMTTSQEEKYAFWDRCKVMNFTRTTCSVYALVLLVVFLRVQVNIVGRYLYLESLIKQDMNSLSGKKLLTSTKIPLEFVLGADTQRKYLTFAEYVLHQGLKQLSHHVERVVTQVMARQYKCTFDDLLNIFDEIRRSVEVPSNEMDNILITFLLPPEEEELELKDRKLQMLLNETRDIIESEEFNQVLKRCLNNAFFMMSSQLSSVFNNPASPSETGETAKPATKEGPVALPMAKLLPHISKQVNAVLDPRPNPFLDSISSHKHLEDYSFELFTAFETGGGGEDAVVVVFRMSISISSSSSIGGESESFPWQSCGNLPDCLRVEWLEVKESGVGGTTSV